MHILKEVCVFEEVSTLFFLFLEYEETVTLLFDCGLFENIHRAACSGMYETKCNNSYSL